MKRFISILLILGILLSLIGCSIRHTEVSRYGEFRNDAYHLCCELSVFPETIKSNWTVEDYQFWYEVLFWELSYIYLNLTFESAAEYESELSRVSSIQGSYFDEDAVFVQDNENFACPAYILCDDTLFFQYILTVPDERRIVYIFTQYFPYANDVKIPEQYLPQKKYTNIISYQ